VNNEELEFDYKKQIPLTFVFGVLPTALPFLFPSVINYSASTKVVLSVLLVLFIYFVQYLLYIAKLIRLSILNTSKALSVQNEISVVQLRIDISLGVLLGTLGPAISSLPRAIEASNNGTHVTLKVTTANLNIGDKLLLYKNPSGKPTAIFVVNNIQTDYCTAIASLPVDPDFIRELSAYRILRLEGYTVVPMKEEE
jgi:hypothetical protein